LQTILDLGRQHNIKLPGDTIETLRPHVQVQEVMPGLLAWLNKLHWMIAVLGDYDACRRISRENVEDAKAECIDYLEQRFSLYFMAGPNRLNLAKVVEAVVAGVEEGRAKTGLKVNLSGIISRPFGAEAGKVELEALLTQPAGRPTLRKYGSAGAEPSTQSAESACEQRPGSIVSGP
jgi:adenosine deaminase